MIVRYDVSFFGNDYPRAQRSYFLLAGIEIRKAAAKKKLERIDRHPPSHSSGCGNAYYAGNDSGCNLCVFLIEALQNINRIEIETRFVSRCKFFYFNLRLPG